MSIVFKAPARLEADDIRKIRSEFDRLAASGQDVVIDLSRTEAIDGSGVGAIVFAFKRLTATGGHLTISNVSGQPLQLLHSADLLRTLGRKPRDGILSDALRSLGLRKPSRRLPASIRQSPPPPGGAGAMPDIEREKGAA